ncbi:MAG: proline iminopeptidase-family hydrolase [Sulfobacillus sp.]
MMEGRSKLIELQNGYRVWTRQVGTGEMPILLLHGGPGANHEYLECLKDHIPLDRFRLYFYDQLGSYFSDQPDDETLWTVQRFCDEVDEVRQALGVEQMILFGQSWGGMLAIEYALKYGPHLKGLVISNMVASIQSYVKHLNLLRSCLPQSAQDEMAFYETTQEYTHPRYLAIMDGLYKEHLCRLDPWPMAVVRSFEHLNPEVYETMQGPNEFFVTGTFKDWDRWGDLDKIAIPSLLIGGRHDTMNPDDVLHMAHRMPDAQAVICPLGSHMAMWDDPEHYYPPLLDFLSAVSASNPNM